MSAEQNVKAKEEATELTKEITTEMPVALPLMILLGDNDLRKKSGTSEHRNKVKLLLDPLNSKYDHLSEDLFRNSDITLLTDDKYYRSIYDTKNNYYFDKLIEYFRFFYGDEFGIYHIESVEDVKQCYKMMIAHQTKTKNKSFSQEFCWKIASLFLNSDYSNINILHEHIIRSYEDPKDTYALRKEMIQKATGDVYIAGTTLKDAFSTASSNKETSIIQELIQNSNINNIYIFALSYKHMRINQETASKEIETSISNIMDAVLRANGHCPKVQIILLNNFSIPFALIANEALLTRSTFLFDYDRKYRGQYLLYSSGDLEFISAKKYFDLLIENAYELEMSPNSGITDTIKQKYRSHKVAYMEKGLTIKKIHPTQLDNLVRTSFVTLDESSTNSIHSVFSIPEKDKTQEVLLPYLQETERLLEKLVTDHDPHGWAKIIPCNDLGFPNNITRIAGGFLTGAYYNWSCAVPIVPVDATVNTCTSSVFKLDNVDFQTFDFQTFEAVVRKVCHNAMESGYAFSLESGNHFLMIAQDKDGTYYLVLHCSAKQAKESCFGLYPSDRAWYRNKIKTIYNENQTRYLRYIRSDTAVRFVDYANRFRDFNEEMHQYIAELFAEEVGATISGKPNIKHHYGMPTPNSIAIGTFTVDTMSNNDSDLIVPVFSDLDKDICLYSVSRKQSKTYTPPGTSQKLVLVPHGWGQVIDEVKKIYVDNPTDECFRKLVIVADRTHRLDVIPKERITFPEKHIRSFDSVSDFLYNHCTNINGDVKTVLHPIFCFCSRTVKSDDSEDNSQGSR